MKNPIDTIRESKRAAFQKAHAGDGPQEKRLTLCENEVRALFALLTVRHQNRAFVYPGLVERIDSDVLARTAFRIEKLLGNIPAREAFPVRPPLRICKASSESRPPPKNFPRK